MCVYVCMYVSMHMSIRILGTCFGACGFKHHALRHGASFANTACGRCGKWVALPISFFAIHFLNEYVKRIVFSRPGFRNKNFTHPIGKANFFRGFPWLWTDSSPRNLWQVSQKQIGGTGSKNTFGSPRESLNLVQSLRYSQLFDMLWGSSSLREELDMQLERSLSLFVSFSNWELGAASLARFDSEPGPEITSSSHIPYMSKTA